MPITVRHTPVGALGKLALLAGRARGRQISAAQDLQFTSMAMAAQNQAAQIGVANNRTFAMQRAGANRIVKQRPVGPTTLETQRKLRRTVAEAQSAGIYSPAQIKQLEIFANLGDESGVRSLLGKLPQETARRRELGAQLEAVTKISQGSIADTQRQLDVVNEQLGLRFTPEMQELLRANPALLDTVDPEIQDLLSQQERLEQQGTAIQTRATRTQQLIRMGISIPEQMTLEGRQQEKISKEEAARQKRLIEQVKEAGKLTDLEELAIDEIQAKGKSRRAATTKSIVSIRRGFGQLEDESDEDYEARIKPLQAQIRMLELNNVKSFGTEKLEIEVLLKRNRGTNDFAPLVTDATGQQWRNTGRRDANGEPLYEVVE